MVHISEIFLWQRLHFRVAQSEQVFTSSRSFSDDVWKGWPSLLELFISGTSSTPAYNAPRAYCQFCKLLGKLFVMSACLSHRLYPHLSLSGDNLPLLDHIYNAKSSQTRRFIWVRFKWNTVVQKDQIQHILGMVAINYMGHDETRACNPYISFRTL